MDTYESNAGLLYCKPHFRELFQPKAVLESPEEKLLQKIKRRPEVIIRENQPVELPPDVVRGETILVCNYIPIYYGNQGIWPREGCPVAN